MKEYLRFFRIPFVLVGILAVVTLVAAAAKYSKTEVEVVSSSQNTERLTTERVFDYADVLTDTEEESLRKLISEAEKDTQCDIVLVTLNESLVEYAAQYEAQIGPVPTSQCVMVYADNFYDEHKFGYNEPYGDGVLLLDNWYREADGWVYNWLTTTGRAEDRYSEAMINNVINDVNDLVEEDPYEAYVSYVENVRRDMTGNSAQSNSMENSSLGIILQPHYILIAAVVIALIFLLVNWSSKKGKRTTTDRTYVVGGNPTFRRREDRFLYKNVTKHKIESSSSSGGRSGGGGHHRSAGGHSHGGGGGRR